MYILSFEERMKIKEQQNISKYKMASKLISGNIPTTSFTGSGVDSRSYQKHLVEYFLLKLNHIYTLSILLTASIFFFMYRSNEKIPQDYLIVFIILGTIGVILSLGVGVHHWLKNGSRNKTLSNATYSQNQDLGETWLKRSQFIITSLFLFTLVIISAVKLNNGNITKEITYGIAVTSFIIFAYTLFVFVYSFYYVAERSHKVNVIGEARRKIQTNRV